MFFSFLFSFIDERCIEKCSRAYYFFFCFEGRAQFCNRQAIKLFQTRINFRAIHRFRGKMREKKIFCCWYCSHAATAVANEADTFAPISGNDKLNFTIIISLFRHIDYFSLVLNSNGHVRFRLHMTSVNGFRMAPRTIPYTICRMGFRFGEKFHQRYVQCNANIER